MPSALSGGYQARYRLSVSSAVNASTPAASAKPLPGALNEDADHVPLMDKLPGLAQPLPVWLATADREPARPTRTSPTIGTSSSSALVIYQIALVENDPTSGASITERWFRARTAPPDTGRRSSPYAYEPGAHHLTVTGTTLKRIKTQPLSMSAPHHHGTPRRVDRVDTSSRQQP